MELRQRPGGDAEVDHACERACIDGAGRERAEVGAVGGDDHRGRRTSRTPARPRARGAPRPGGIRRQPWAVLARGGRSRPSCAARSARSSAAGGSSSPKKIVQTRETASISGVATEATRRRFARVFAPASMPGPRLSSGQRQADQPGERPRQERPEQRHGEHPDHRRGGGTALAAAARGRERRRIRRRGRPSPASPLSTRPGGAGPLASRSASVGRMRDARRALANAASWVVTIAATRPATNGSQPTTRWSPSGSMPGSGEQPLFEPCGDAR